MFIDIARTTIVMGWVGRALTSRKYNILKIQKRFIVLWMEYKFVTIDP